MHVWLPRDADAGRAVEVLRGGDGPEVTVAETTAEGVRLAVGGERCPPPERAAREAELRLRCLRRLHAEGLLPRPSRASGAASGEPREASYNRGFAA